LERLGVWHCKYILFGYPAEAVNSRTIEEHAFLKGSLELGWRDVQRLQLTVHVGKHQAH